MLHHDLFNDGAFHPPSCMTHYLGCTVKHLILRLHVVFFTISLQFIFATHWNFEKILFDYLYVKNNFEVCDQCNTRDIFICTICVICDTGKTRVVCKYNSTTTDQLYMYLNTYNNNKYNYDIICKTNIIYIINNYISAMSSTQHYKYHSKLLLHHFNCIYNCI